MRHLITLLLILATVPAEAGIFRRRRGNYSRSTYSAPATPVAAVDVSTALYWEQQIVIETNAVRARHGLGALVLDGRLLGTARAHGTWMTRNRSMMHSHFGVAENIARGQRTAHEVVVNWWYNSSGHRANMLNPSHSRIGVSAYTSPDGMVFWCQQFAR